MIRTSAFSAPRRGSVAGAATAEVSSQRLAKTLISIARRGDGPDHLGLVGAGVAVAVRQRALEAEAVAGLEHDAAAFDPQLEAAADDDACLLARMGVGLVA